MMHLCLDGAQCNLVEDRNGYFIYSLGTRPEYRRKGAAKRLLRAIRKFADRNNVCIGLHVDASDPWLYKKPPLDNEDLITKLYGRMGFKVTEGHRMEYKPKGARYRSRSSAG